MKDTGHRIVKIILIEKKKVRGLILPNKAYFKTPVIKTVWYWWS